METRNILDINNAVIGTLTLPDNTSEEDWARALESYKEKAEIPDVTPRQIRQALIMNGVSLATIDSALNSLPEPVKSMANVEWEYSIAFQRNRPLVNSVGIMLGWTSDQLDALWKLAGTL